MTGPVSLRLDRVNASHGGNTIVRDLSFTIEPSRFVTLLGPSGCGKSTTLRGVAGLHEIDGGEIWIGDQCVASADIHVRPEHRGLNMVFQSYAIWPHMSVSENVGYGLRRSGMATAEIGRRVGEMLELVGLSAYADRRATGLSGGQQQRVALARALATRPRILLLDEPLSNLDAVLRQRMRQEISRIQREAEVTTLYVTHDCGEALAMSDEIIVMDAGRIAQIAKPDSLYRQPANRFIASFLGPANIVPGRVEAVTEATIAVRVADLDGEPVLTLPRGDRPVAVADTVDLVFRPERLALTGGKRGQVAGTLIGSEYLGSHTNIQVQSGAVVLAVSTLGMPALAAGATVRIEVDEDAVAWLPREQNTGNVSE